MAKEKRRAIGPNMLTLLHLMTTLRGEDMVFTTANNEFVPP
jgi:hypothetical protein